MLDDPSGNGPWSDEPTEDEIATIILDLKNEMIKCYELRLKDSDTLELIVPPHEETRESILYRIGRERLSQVLDTHLYYLIPIKYHELFRNLLVNWIPEAKQPP